MHCIPETPPPPRPCKGLLGDPPDSGSTQTFSISESEMATSSTSVSAMPWQVVAPGPSLREVIAQLLAQVSPGDPPRGTPEKISTIFQETQHLLASSVPWVMMTEDRQQANCLLQPTAPSQVAESILARLEQVLVRRDWLVGALLTAPHVLIYYMSYLMAVSIAQLVPHQLQATQEDMRSVVGAVRSLPPGSMLTVSSDLVDDLLVQLIMKLHPLQGLDGYRQLDQQKLLALTLQLSALTLEMLRNMPGVAVVTALPRPRWNFRRLTFQVQSHLMEVFGTFYQVKKLMAAGNPELLRCIPRQVIEVVLAQHHAVATKGTPALTKAPSEEEDRTQSRLFSQTLPEMGRDPLFQDFGSWIPHAKLFCATLPEISDEVIADYRHVVLQRRSSSYTTWVEGKYFVRDDCEEATSSLDNVTPADTAFVVDGSGEALQRDFQDSQEDRKLLQGPTESEPSSLPGSSQSFLACNPVLTGALRPSGTQPLPGCSAAAGVTSADVLIQRSTASQIVGELFRGQDQTFYRSQACKYRAFEKEIVEHVHLLLEKEAAAYRNNRVFRKTLERLKDPVQELRLAVELRRPLRHKLNVALPYVWLTREGFMQDPQVALLACSLVAEEVLNHIKPSVRFSEDVQGGDNTPYSMNIPVRKGEEGEREGPLTLLEERLHNECKANREEFLTCPEKEPELKEVKKKTKWFSWLFRLFGYKKN